MNFIYCLLCFALLLRISYELNTFLPTASERCPSCLNCTTLTRHTRSLSTTRYREIRHSILYRIRNKDKYCERCPRFSYVRRWLKRLKRHKRSQKKMKGLPCSGERWDEGRLSSRKRWYKEDEDDSMEIYKRIHKYGEDEEMEDDVESSGEEFKEDTFGEKRRQKKKLDKEKEQNMEESDVFECPVCPKCEVDVALRSQPKKSGKKKKMKSLCPRCRACEWFRKRLKEDEEDSMEIYKRIHKYGVDEEMEDDVESSGEEFKEDTISVERNKKNNGDKKTNQNMEENERIVNRLFQMKTIPPDFANETAFGDHTTKLQQTTLPPASDNGTQLADPTLNVFDKKSHGMQSSTIMAILSTSVLICAVIVIVCCCLICKKGTMRTMMELICYPQHSDRRRACSEENEYEHDLVYPPIFSIKSTTFDELETDAVPIDTIVSIESRELLRKSLLEPEQSSGLTSKSQKDEKNDEDDICALLRTNDCGQKQLNKMGVDSFDLPIKEKTFNFNDACKKVSMVKPLQSPGPEAAKTSENVNISQLDWNKIFSFLTTIIKPSELKLFMVHLVDGKDTSVDTIVDRIQNENSSSVERIYKCLKHWKQLMGNDADPQHIIKAMEERGLNEDAYKFKEFMRNPPTVKSTVNSAVPFHSLCAPENFNLLAYMVTGASNNDSLFNQSTSTRYIAENPTTPIIEEPDDDPRLSRKNYKNNNSPSSSDTHFKQSVNRKRKLPIDRLSRHGKRKCKILNKSNYELKQQFKTLRRRKSRKYLRATIALQKQCIINLIKDPCCLQEVSYKTLMHYAIYCLMKYTNAPEDAIFSLKYTDYEKIQKTSHSENGELYLLHWANTGKFHVFGKDEYETLKLYVKNARKRRIKELKDSVGKSFVEPEALFLNYKGEPIRTKNVQTNRQCSTSTPSSTSEENSDSNTSLSSTINVEPESQSDWATCISSDQSYDDSAGSEVLLGSKLLNSMNDDAELTTTSAGQNIATQNISDNNDTATLNICTNVSGQERNSSSDSAGCVTEIKCANISNDRLQTNAEILSICLHCIIEERRKLLNTTNRNVEDIELD